jgi:hypothetical protein
VLNGFGQAVFRNGWSQLPRGRWFVGASARGSAWRSQETNLKVRDLAARFLDAVAGTASSDTRTHIDHALLTLE